MDAAGKKLLCFPPPYLHTVKQNQSYSWLVIVKACNAGEQLVQSELFVGHGMQLTYIVSINYRVADEPKLYELLS